MASDGDEDVSSRSHSESSDDSDSQDSDNMRVTPPADPKGDTLIRKPKDSKVKKANAKDPNRVKRKKARRACENCQRAHLTCSEYTLRLAINPILAYPAPLEQATTALARDAATRRFAKMGFGRRQST